MKYNICAVSCNQEDHDDLIEKYPKLHDFNYSVIERQEWEYTLYDSYIEINTLDELNRLIGYVESIVIDGLDEDRASYMITIYDGYLE